ncbi:FCD domain-containing protein [Dactylosporangium sp. NBC_01737]|uniref:FadR/GntR family transcriptional regulator n=1 Tax=Dactylosporangium sp. NBC_01737 TaxID=2975959 RepID=UPI002E0DC13A|nr:FCD domain-containing protein [Dactylosporangium sp. NBC_01737]
MSGTGFAKLQRTSAAADAARSIQQMIVDGRLAPGQRLPAERELSELLGISRPTLRETIRSLVGLNILESRHGAGTFVAALDTATLLEPMQFVMALNERTLGELFEARLLLEPALAALAAQRATDAQVAAMRAAIGGAEQIEADVRLHRLIAESSGNALLAAMLESLSTLGRSSRSITSARPGVRRRTAADHEAIVVAVERRDPDAARAAMTAHLERIAATLA